MKESLIKDVVQDSEERGAKTSEDRYPSEDEASSKLDIISIPASEPYKPIVKRKVSLFICKTSHLKYYLH